MMAELPDDVMLAAAGRVWDATVAALTPACSCGGRGICAVCVLAAFNDDDEAQPERTLRVAR